MKKRLKKLLPNGNHRRERVSNNYYALADISVAGKNYAKGSLDN